jgi:hypothetical protein
MLERIKTDDSHKKKKNHLALVKIKPKLGWIFGTYLKPKLDLKLF